MSNRKKTSDASAIRLLFTFFPSVLLRTLYLMGEVLRFGLLLLFSALLIFYAVRFVPHGTSYEYVRFVLDLESQFRAFYNHYLAMMNLPKVSSHGVSQLALILGVLFVRMVISMFTLRARNYADYLAFRETFKQWLNKSRGPKDKDEVASLEEKLKRFVESGKKGRQDLLDLFGELQRNLEAMKKDLTFLSIDVIDSTGMKEGEDTPAIELDFRRYNQLLKKAFQRHGYLKAVWTPDGVMSCFETADEAVRAARQILHDLKDFNRKEKTIKRDFSIRCGINSGKVAYDENMPLEILCDHVLDVAGHFQKNGLPNTICISKHAYERLSERGGFKPADRKIDNLEMYIGT